MKNAKKSSDNRIGTLSKNNTYNKLLFVNSPIGLALCDLDGQLIDVNPAYAKIIGRSVEDTLSLSYWDITPKKYKELEDRQILLLKTCQKYGPYEKEYIHKDGRLVPVRLSGLIVELGGEKYIWSSVENISMQVKAQDKEQELKIQLQQSQKMEAMGQLVGGIAHDFNNTLSCITGYSDLALEHIAKNNYQKLPEFLKRINTAGNQSKEMIKKLLTFNRGSGSEFARVNPNDAVKESLELLRVGLPKETSLQLKLEDEITHIKANSNQLKQIVMNLCINARDAIEDKTEGQITVKLQKTKIAKSTCLSCHKTFNGDYLMLSVSDNGIGIGEKDLSRIFDPFFSTKMIGSGTGLGLSMVHGLVHEHNGHISVVTQQNKGTEFKLFFPVDDPSHTAHSREKSERDEQPPADKILVVDDNESHASLIEEMLSFNDYHVVKATSPTEALKTFKKSPGQFSLVISDQRMPEMTGIQLSNRIQEVRKDIPIVICTGYSEYDNPSILKMGFEGVLSKPVKMHELLNVCSKFATTH